MHAWYGTQRHAGPLYNKELLYRTKEAGGSAPGNCTEKQKKLSITQTMVTKQLIITVSADELRSYVLLIIHTCLRCLCIIYVVCPSYCIVYNYNLFFS